ncbi:MAG: hypothetical protein A3C43_03765 [Candidatus Schekmanbacteria bacterium RIFCSPHIGHO2_02_FULL_38_11]|uniref:Uncharacterized protein n=1 Tax=Candidatus Schekmanbacteria bacterium RIFCSPLOWO2_12_FULL_38_15 TaxID=1817883 RepID=A0A1F7SQF3_9BACT|nr:MAG: hypothetical protein A3C43_03765 [Candidatus Schekmanbacteria bacterium RIFCSPHIGHO2_02_FULL_38_11]OGL55437.1 MAG: hypothetical protein A3G31_01325 [Candidatus Schekmanbacteria bacterium RIFCSPLOWO2_12_FULL_38_15]
MIEEVFLILKRKWFICALAFLFAISASYVFEKEASAAKTYNIVVKIKSNKATNRTGVAVEVTGGDLTTPKTATTKKTGIVKFTKLAKGTYTVTPAKEGYTFDPESKPVTFATRRTVNVVFKSTEVVIPVTEEAITLSTSANGTHFAAGEKPIITISLPDLSSRSDYSQLRLVVYGPQETTKTKTAVNLLNASTDRSLANTGPHHYIDLVTDTNVQLNDNILTYTLQPITDEEAGTYTASLWAVLKDDPSVQSFPLADFQIGTATAETQIVERENCSVCHKGADSGKYYFHHIDPRTAGSSGYPSIDSWAVRTCKSCHNTDGYAAYTDPANPSATDGSNKIPDPIVKRVHGVHMGEELKNALNTDATTGIFKNYTSVVFPANVKNCTMCHVDDKWKTTPSRLACGACHDNIWFGDPAALPSGQEAHPGLQQDSDTGCSTCHPADGSWTKGSAPAPISTVHKVDSPAYKYTVEISLSAPANETHYVAGEAPQVTITIKDATTGATIDPNTLTETAFSRASLYVSGPRENTKPVLTTSAKGLGAVRALATNSKDGPWDLSGDPTFIIGIDGTSRTVTAAASNFANPAAATQAEVITWLKKALPDGIGDVATVSASGTTKVTIKSNTRGSTSKVEIFASSVATAMGWTVGAKTPAPRSYASNDFRVRKDSFDEDPKVSRSTTAVTYQLDDVAGLTSGTYTAFAQMSPTSGFGGSAVVNFQVGGATEEKKVATNCTNCHGDTTMHSTSLSVPFNPDICKNCHDYNREGTGYGWAGAPPTGTNGTSTSGWSGFGAKPLSSRIHGVHRGRYLEHPEDVKPLYRLVSGVATYWPEYDFSEVIFPQDIRNCTKCHSADTTGTWKTEPSRLACLACHDNDEATTHGNLMTYDTTPTDPWSGDEIETCVVCHGSGRDFSPDKVHNISSPYKPPYLREPAE